MSPSAPIGAAKSFCSWFELAKMKFTLPRFGTPAVGRACCQVDLSIRRRRPQGWHHPLRQQVDQERSSGVAATPTTHGPRQYPGIQSPPSDRPTRDHNRLVADGIQVRVLTPDLIDYGLAVHHRDKVAHVVPRCRGAHQYRRPVLPMSSAGAHPTVSRGRLRWFAHDHDSTCARGSCSVSLAYGSANLLPDRRRLLIKVA